MDEWQQNDGYVTSGKAVLELIADFEYQTNSKFSVYRQEKLYGNEENLDLQKISNFEVRWKDCQRNVVPPIPLDKVPFIILGKKVWDCHQGKQRNKKLIEKNRQKRFSKEDHDFRRRRKEVQTSKKLECPLQIRVRHIIKFPTFEIEDDVAQDKHRKEALSKSLRATLEENKDCSIQHRYYVSLPNEQHQNHLVGEAGCLIQPVEETIKKFIQTTVFEQNITSTKEMRLLVEMHVRQRFQDSTLPPKTNKRFWPSIKDLQNHIAFALRKQRNSTLDQAIVQGLVEKWKEENPKDSFELRLKEDVDEAANGSECPADISSDEIRFGDELATSLYGNQKRFLFVYQSAAQKRLLERYGNDICLMDATYRTTKYALPLYFLCVPTNVNYMVVAMFILETEDSNSIKEALSILKEWNPNWKPTYFMCDHAEEEIGALETIFPESFVYLCDFHREQSWDRWLTASHNGVAQSKASILQLFRNIAAAMTEQEYEESKNALLISDYWKGNNRLQSWFENTWLKKHKRWVKAYRQCVFNVLVNTNNGVERQNKALKYEYLDMRKTKSLSQLLSTVHTKFFPDSNVKYMRMNAAASDLARGYGESIPDFLKNRPRQIVDHCYPRWEDSANIPAEDVDEIGEGNFLVRSQQSTALTYHVQFKQQESDMPHCDCLDWKRSHLICKHFMAVFRYTDFSWNGLPEVYRENPILNLDLEHINLLQMGDDQTSQVRSTHSEEIGNIDEFVTEDCNISDLPISSAANLKRLRSRVGNLCQLMREWVYHCSDSNLLSSVETDLSTLVLKVKASTPKDGHFIIDANPMTHIGGTRVSNVKEKSLRKLPSRSRKRKGSGRVGVRAEMTQRMQTRKGAVQLCTENDIHTVEEIVDNICDIEEPFQDSADGSTQASNDNQSKQTMTLQDKFKDPVPIKRRRIVPNRKGSDEAVQEKDKEPCVFYTAEDVTDTTAQTAKTATVQINNKKVQFTDEAKRFKERKLMQLKKSCPDPFPGGGLLNPPKKNLCFVNSLLQCLRLTDLHTVIQHHRNCKASESCFICSLQEFLENAPISAEQLCERMIAFWPDYKIGIQQDSHELYTKIMEEIQAKCFRLVRMSDNRRIFYGQLQYLYCCKLCGSTSCTTELFSDLSLSIVKHQTVGQCLDAYFSVEVLDKRCMRCGKNTEHSRKLQLKTIPKNLVVHLKRFTNRSTKIMKKIDIQINLNMRQYVVESGEEEHKLDLFGIVVHKGQTMNTGHYIAVVKFGTELYRVDDMKITKVSTNFVNVIDGQPTILMYRSLKRPYTKEY